MKYNLATLKLINFKESKLRNRAAPSLVLVPISGPIPAICDGIGIGQMFYKHQSFYLCITNDEIAFQICQAT